MEIEVLESSELAQITVQITTANQKRALPQTKSGEPFGVAELVYSELSREDQKVWDDFEKMIESKTSDQ